MNDKVLNSKLKEIRKEIHLGSIDTAFLGLMAVIITITFSINKDWVMPILVIEFFILVIWAFGVLKNNIPIRKSALKIGIFYSSIYLFARGFSDTLNILIMKYPTWSLIIFWIVSIIIIVICFLILIKVDKYLKRKF